MVQDNHDAVVDDQPELAGEPAPEPAKDEELFVERGWGRTAAHAVLPERLSIEELTASTAAVRATSERLADRGSQDGAHVSEADLDAGLDAGTEAGDGYEAGRRRREGAELADAQVGPTATTSDSWDAS